MEAALHAGVDALQLRDKDLGGAESYRLARDLSALARRAGALFLVNDRVDVAHAIRAHGVQLGAGSIAIGEARRLLPAGSLIGYSAHSPAEAEGAALAGADFVLMAPVYTPGSKGAAPPGGWKPIGPPVLWRTAAALPIPVYALGGVDATRLRELLHPPAGAGRAPAGAAVISAILAQDDPGDAARRLLAAFDATTRS